MNRDIGKDLGSLVYNAPKLQEVGSKREYAQRFYEREQRNPYLRRGFVLEFLGIGAALIVAAKVAKAVYRGFIETPQQKEERESREYAAEKEEAERRRIESDKWDPSSWR